MLLSVFSVEGCFGYPPDIGTNFPLKHVSLYQNLLT